MCTPRRPLHLLLFDEPLADDLINRRFDKRCTDRFALTIAFPEVRNEFDVVSDVGLELGGDSEALSISTLRLIGHSRFHRGENASFANPLCHRNGAIVVRSIVFVDCLRSGVAADTKKR